MTTTLANATAGDLDLRGQAIVTTVGKDGKARPSGVWLAWIKTHGLSDLYVIDNKFAPGGTSGWHSHAGPSLIFVLNGTVTNYSSDDPTCSPKTYGKGSSFVDAGGDDVHMLRNEGTEVAETIAVQFIPQGIPRRTDKPEPANCHV
jgi:quercetin dioxygenase-like cupin family protein